MFRTSLMAIALFTLVGPVAAKSDGLVHREELTLAQARTMIVACEEFAADKNLSPLAMAVYDASGNLKLFSRQDGAILIASEFAQTKARTSATLGMSTRALGDDVEFTNNDRPLGLRYVDNLIVVPGGIPITSLSGQLLAGFGVSGAQAADDEACARAGYDAVKGSLK